MSGLFMHYKQFTIPVIGDGQELNELNRFINGNRIVSINKTMIQHDSQYCWSLLKKVAFLKCHLFQLKVLH